MQRFQEDNKVAYASDVSESQGYSVLDWSLWAQKDGSNITFAEANTTGPGARP